MSSFSGVTFVSFCIVFIVFISKLEAVALRSIALRSWICMRPDSRTYFFLFAFIFVGDVAFSRIFSIPLPFYFLYGECVTRFPFPGGIFLPCDHGLDCLHQLI